jgi:hypothetical protein
MRTSLKRALPVISLLVIALTLGLKAVGPAQSSAAVDFRVLVQRHFDLLDQGNVAAVMDMFSDDAVVSGASCVPTPCVGKAAIQKEIERRVNNGATQTLTSLQERTSGKGSGSLRITERGFPACNVERIIVLFDIEVANDKITLFASRPDLSDPQSAAFVACMAARAAPAIAPPRAGDGGLRR